MCGSLELPATALYYTHKDAGARLSTVEESLPEKRKKEKKKKQPLAREARKSSPVVVACQPREGGEGSKVMHSDTARADIWARGRERLRKRMAGGKGKKKMHAECE